MRTERPRDLDGERADPAARSVHEDAAARPDPTLVAQPLQGRDRRHRDGGRLLERQVGRLVDEPLLPHDHPLGERADGHPEHLVARPELRDPGPDRLDDACHVRPEAVVPGLGQPVRDADEVRQAAQRVPVEAVSPTPHGP